MISAAKPPLSPTCSTGPHERSEPAHHLRASLVNIVATEPWWVELLKEGVHVAYMSLDEWKSLGATQQAIEDRGDDGEEHSPQSRVRTGAAFAAPEEARRQPNQTFSQHGSPQSKAGAICVDRRFGDG